jgi:hypothetical protein
MLGVTLAEKVYHLEVGGTSPPPSIAELQGIIGIDFIEVVQYF